MSLSSKSQVVEPHYVDRPIHDLGPPNDRSSDQLLNLLQDHVTASARLGYTAHSEGGPLPQVVVIDLRDRDVELRSYRGRRRAHDPALVLQGHAGGDEELVTGDADEHVARGLAGYLLRLEGLDQVALLDVLEALEPDAALESRLHLAHVVFEAPQGRDGRLVHDRAVSHEPRLRIATDRPVQHHAPRDQAQARHAERRAHLGLPQRNLLELR